MLSFLLTTVLSRRSNLSIVCVCLDDNFWTKWITWTSIYVLVHLDTIWVEFSGQGHKSDWKSLGFTSSFAHFLLFPFFLFSFALTIFFFCPSLPFSTRIVPLHFQARGRRRRPNLVLVCLCWFFMVALCNRADHYIFALWFLLLFFLA